MAFLKIPNVTVGQWKPGTIFGDCMIFSFNMKFGVGEGKTTCSMSILNKKGKYPKELTEVNPKTGDVPYLSYLNHFDILVGDSLATGVKTRMYLVGAQETNGPEGKYFQLNFVDGSHILDRTFVGLLHRHDGNNRPINVGRLMTGFSLPVVCPPCDPNSNKVDFKRLDPDGSIYDINGNRVTGKSPWLGRFLQRSIDFSKQIPIGNNKIGGMVIVGTEKWSKSDCDLKDVDYNFTELVIALNKFGISLNIRDRNPDYRANHVGTAREVIASWCADFGISWSYDALSILPTIYETGNNTAKAINQISLINTVARGIDQTTSKCIVENIDYGVSIEETYRQFLVSAYKKPSTPKEYKKATYYRTYFRNIGVEDIFIEKKFLDGRTYEQFKISCCFARFAPELRTLYLLSLGSTVPLGFNSKLKLSNVLKKQIINYCLNTDSYLSLLEYIAGKNSSLANIADADFDMFLGSYDQNMEDSYIEWEKNVAETFGKYYMSSILPTDRKICPQGINEKYEMTTSTLPEATFFYKKFETKKKSACQPAVQILSHGSVREIEAAKYEAKKYILTNNVPGGLPFNNILRGPLGKDIYTLAPPHVVVGGGGALKFSEFVRIFERDGSTWNKDEADWECQLTNPVTDESLVEKYMPRYQPVTGLIKTRLLSIFAGRDEDIRKTIEGANGQAPTLMILPKKKRLQKLLKVSGFSIKENKLEVENTIAQRAIAKTKEKDCSKTALCEIQADISSMACDCTRGAGPPPANKRASVLYDAKGSPYIDGLLNNKSLSFTWTFNPDDIEKSEQKVIPGRGTKFVKTFDKFVSSMNVVFPCGSNQVGDNELYQANFLEDSSRTVWRNKIQEIRNDFLRYPVGNVSSVRVVPNELTQNMDAIPTNLTGGQEVKVFLPPSNFQGLGKLIDLNAYHHLMNSLNHLGTAWPRASLTVSLGSCVFGELLPYLKTQFGLQDFNVKIDDSGASATISWTSGLSKKPKEDLVMTQVIPRAKYSMFVG